MKPAIASLFALGTTFCLMGTKTRHEVPTFGTSWGIALERRRLLRLSARKLKGLAFLGVHLCMRTFETAEDVLKGAKEVHHCAHDLFGQLQTESPNERAQLLLGYLAKHEGCMEQKLDDFLHDAPRPLLNTWMQYTLEVPPKSFIVSLGAHSDMSVEEFGRVSDKIERYLVELFEEIKHTTHNVELCDVFTNLMTMEHEERQCLSRSRASIWDW